MIGKVLAVGCATIATPVTAFFNTGNDDEDLLAFFARGLLRAPMGAPMLLADAPMGVGQDEDNAVKKQQKGDKKTAGAAARIGYKEDAVPYKETYVGNEVLDAYKEKKNRPKVPELFKNTANGATKL